MELDITMRYVMVQARRKAGAGPVCVEHVFTAVLELFDKETADIARKPEHALDIGAGLEGVKQFVNHKKLDVWPTLYLLNEALADNLQGDVPPPESDMPGWLARHNQVSFSTLEYTVLHFLEGFKKTRTPLLDWCWAEYDNKPTPRIAAADKGMELLAARLGFTPRGDASAAKSLVDAGNDMSSLLFSSERPSCGPEFESGPVAEPAEPVFHDIPPPPSGLEVVFLNIPAPGAAEDAESVIRRGIPKPGSAPRPHPPNKGPVSKTRIAGFTFKGGPFKAAVKYFAPVFIIPIALYFLLYAKLEQQLFENVWYSALMLVGTVFFTALFFRGIFALLGRLCKPLEFFANTAVNIIGVALTALILVHAGGYARPPAFIKVIIIICALMLMRLCLGRLRQTACFLSSSQAIHELRTGMGKVCGTPSTIFFEYALRSCFVPLLAFAVIWIGNLQINGFWRAVFSIYGFLWAYELIRVLLHSWDLAKRRVRLSQFLLFQHYLLGLPELGLFLMWYFNWLPMRTWVIVLYGIYGLLWLWFTAGLLIVFARKGAQL